MSERLSNEELARLAEIANTHTGGITMGQRNARLVFEELAQRRAADLDAGERAVALAAIRSIREEADFNRSWTDGRRGDHATVTPEYIARRVGLAEERDRWAAVLEKLLGGA